MAAEKPFAQESKAFLEACRDGNLKNIMQLTKREGSDDFYAYLESNIDIITEPKKRKGAIRLLAGEGNKNPKDRLEAIQYLHKTFGASLDLSCNSDNPKKNKPIDAANEKGRTTIVTYFQKKGLSFSKPLTSEEEKELSEELEQKLKMQREQNKITPLEYEIINYSRVIYPELPDAIATKPFAPSQHNDKGRKLRGQMVIESKDNEDSVFRLYLTKDQIDKKNLFERGFADEAKYEPTHGQTLLAMIMMQNERTDVSLAAQMVCLGATYHDVTFIPSGKYPLFEDSTSSSITCKSTKGNVKSLNLAECLFEAGMQSEKIVPKLAELFMALDAKNAAISDPKVNKHIVTFQTELARSLCAIQQYFGIDQIKIDQLAQERINEVLQADYEFFEDFHINDMPSTLTFPVTQEPYRPFTTQHTPLAHSAPPAAQEEVKVIDEDTRNLIKKHLNEGLSGSLIDLVSELYKPGADQGVLIGEVTNMLKQSVFGNKVDPKEGSPAVVALKKYYESPPTNTLGESVNLSPQNVPVFECWQSSFRDSALAKVNDVVASVILEQEKADLQRQMEQMRAQLNAEQQPLDLPDVPGHAIDGANAAKNKPSRDENKGTEVVL